MRIQATRKMRHRRSWAKVSSGCCPHCSPSSGFKKLKTGRVSAAAAPTPESFPIAPQLPLQCSAQLSSRSMSAENNSPNKLCRGLSTNAPSEAALAGSPCGKRSEQKNIKHNTRGPSKGAAARACLHNGHAKVCSARQARPSGPKEALPVPLRLQSCISQSATVLANRSAEHSARMARAAVRGGSRGSAQSTDKAVRSLRGSNSLAKEGRPTSTASRSSSQQSSPRRAGGSSLPDLPSQAVPTSDQRQMSPTINLTKGSLIFGK
mmetsp:Transcript_72165/g.182534  ORF Transcript_72165/g.182534 Transcript_72165/m.182534 type:complete len:264 (+) Transcript_72165:321-1112(+)